MTSRNMTERPRNECVVTKHDGVATGPWHDEARIAPLNLGKQIVSDRDRSAARAEAPAIGRRKVPRMAHLARALVRDGKAARTCAYPRERAQNSLNDSTLLGHVRAKLYSGIPKREFRYGRTGKMVDWGGA